MLGDLVVTYKEIISSYLLIGVDLWGRRFLMLEVEPSMQLSKTVRSSECYMHSIRVDSYLVYWRMDVGIVH